MRNKPLVVASVGLLAAMAGSALWAASILPAGTRVPIHWGIDGRVDGTASAGAGLLLSTVSAAPAILVLAMLGAIEPRSENLARSQGLIRAVWIGMLGLFAVFHLVILEAAFGRTLGGPRLILGAVGLLLAVIGNQLGKSRSMYMVGIRTPWTLADEDVWIATHRLGGKLFVIAGLGWLALAFLLPLGQTSMGIALGLLLIAVAIPLVYSCLLWRKGRPTTP